MSYEDLCAAFIFPTGAEISQLLRDIGDISDNDIYENNKSSSCESDSN